MLGEGLRNRTLAPGFTLLELVNLLALGCILATLGMYGLAAYVRHEKVAEANGTIKQIAESAVAYYEVSDAKQPAGVKPELARAMRHFPPSSRGSVPGDLETIRGKRYQSTRGDWSVSPWSDLNFSLSRPQFYAYSFDSQGSGSEARASANAQGDLDGDGVRSSFRLSVAPDEQFHAKVALFPERVLPDE